MRPERDELLVRLLMEWPPEVHLLAEGEVVLVGPRLTTAPVPWGNAFGYPADVEPMAECSRSIRPPPFREAISMATNCLLFTISTLPKMTVLDVFVDAHKKTKPFGNPSECHRTRSVNKLSALPVVALFVALVGLYAI